MMKMKQKIIKILLLIILSFNIFSQELELHIGEGVYYREMPKTKEDMETLIFQLVNMYNSLNKDYLDLYNASKNEIDKFIIYLKDTSKEINSINENVKSISTLIDNSNNDIKKYINSVSLLNKNTFSLASGLGADMNLSNINFSIMGTFKVTNNIYTASSLLLLPINNQSSNILFTVYIGYWLF